MVRFFFSNVLLKVENRDSESSAVFFFSVESVQLVAIGPEGALNIFAFLRSLFAGVGWPAGMLETQSLASSCVGGCGTAEVCCWRGGKYPILFFCRVDSLPSSPACPQRATLTEQEIHRLDPIFDTESDMRLASARYSGRNAGVCRPYSKAWRLQQQSTALVNLSTICELRSELKNRNNKTYEAAIRTIS